MTEWVQREEEEEKEKVETGKLAFIPVIQRPLFICEVKQPGAWKVSWLR